MRIGTAGYPQGSKGPLDALDRLSEAGLDALEVEFVRQVRMGEDKAKALGERARELGIVLSAHAPYYINLNSKDPEVIERSIDRITRTAEVAHLMGARLIVVHAALYHDRPAEEVTMAVMDGVRRCRSMISENELSPMIGLEVMGKKSAWGRIGEIGEVVTTFKGVVPVVDFAHLHAFGGGSLRSVEDVRRALREVSEFYQGPLHCHYSSVEYGERGERRHLPLKAEEPRFDMVAEALLEWGEEVTVICESTSPFEDAMSMRRTSDRLFENRIQ